MKFNDKHFSIKNTQFYHADKLHLVILSMWVNDNIFTQNFFNQKGNFCVWLEKFHVLQWKFHVFHVFSLKVSSKGLLFFKQIYVYLSIWKQYKNTIVFIKKQLLVFFGFFGWITQDGLRYRLLICIVLKKLCAYFSEKCISFKFQILFLIPKLFSCNQNCHQICFVWVLSQLKIVLKKVFV